MCKIKQFELEIRQEVGSPFNREITTPLQTFPLVSAIGYAPWQMPEF